MNRSLTASGDRSPGISHGTYAGVVGPRQVPIVHSPDDEKVDALIAARDDEEREWMILDKLLV